MSDPVCVRGYREGDEEAFLELHNRAYPEPRTRAHWDWRFADHPGGGVELSGAFDASGKCLAVCSAVSHRLWLQGEVGLVRHWSDLALDPDLREGLAGRLLVRVGRDFLRRAQRGATKLEHGWPESRLRPLVLRFLDGDVLGDVQVSIREVARPLEAGGDVELTPSAELGREHDEHWERLRGELACSLVRDAAYLRWRYREHPSRSYEFLEARDPESGRLRGLCVLGAGGEQQEALVLLEWLVPAHDEATERALLRRAADHARETGFLYLAAWFGFCAEPLQRFQARYGFRGVPTPLVQVFASRVPGLERDWLHRNWYQTLGDTDVF